MLVAMPNKREKAELITQKLTEIWVQNICFWISEHSIIRKRNEKKSERLHKISHEALEQSRWIKIPEIRFIGLRTELKDFVNWKNVVLANMNGLSYWEIAKDLGNDLCWGVWPEWWFSEEDLKLFEDAKIIDLWNSILRMETASIVLARVLKNIN